MAASRLDNVLKTGKNLNLENLFDYLQGIAEGLASVTRWEAREKIAGQSTRENDLQHIFKATFLTVMLSVVENAKRTKNNKLDIGMLAAMAMVHDMGEITEGDIAYFLKVKNNRKEDINEFRAFCRIAEPMPEEAKQYFIGAMMQTMPGDKNYIDTKEARFFCAIERLLAFKRILHECRQGNLHFAPKSLDLEVPDLRKYSKEFTSLKNVWEPYVKELQKYFEKFTQERAKYIAEFVRRGGKEKDFPF